MKKLILALLLFSTPCYADTISLNTISSDSVAGTHNTNFTTIANVINGNIEGSTDSGASVANIKADSIFEINMADNANGRLRDSELLTITTDTQSGSSLTQNTFVYSGCVPADDTDLTSDISACVAYVNGYRVSKAATSNTYTASRDCYVDISQSGTYTTSCVTLGAAAPSVASNSARVSKVVTNGTEISTVTDLANRRLPGLVVPAHYRTGLHVSKDSTTTITVLPGTCEINNAMVNKTSTTTLTISTAGDYAGGSSLRATNTFGFVGMDDDGNIKLHTTAPTHDNYGVSTTAGKKRYATWSSTVYRILGWFYMDGASSGLVEVASNLKDGDMENRVQSNDNTVYALSSTTPILLSNVRFYNSGGTVLLQGSISGDTPSAGVAEISMMFGSGGTVTANSGSVTSTSAASQSGSVSTFFSRENAAQATSTQNLMGKVASTSMNVNNRRLIVREE